MTGRTTATSPAKSASGKRVVFLYNAQAINTNIHRPMLPVSIQSIMPHINLHLGTDMNNSSSPIICCLMDTAAALLLAIIISLPPLPSSTHNVLLRSSYRRTIPQSFYQELSRIMLTPSPLIYTLHFNFIYPISPRMGVQLLLWLPGPK